MRTRLLASPALVWLLTLTLGGTAQAVAIENVGHRGFSSDYPENTLVAVNAAFDAGADRVEIDLQKSSDGQVVIFHDDTLGRTTNGTGNVADHTLAQLQTLDAGSWFDSTFAGEPIPTLEQALLEAQGRGPLLLDQKSDLLFGSEIAAALAATSFPASQAYVTAWDEAQVADIESQMLGITILWTEQIGPLVPAEIPSFLSDMGAIGVDGFSFISEYYTQFSPGFATAAHAAGFLTYAWNFTEQGVTKMEDVIAAGLDGYIVNDVATFESVIPEPTTALLLAAGLAALAASQRRR